MKTNCTDLASHAESFCLVLTGHSSVSGLALAASACVFVCFYVCIYAIFTAHVSLFEHVCSEKWFEVMHQRGWADIWHIAFKMPFDWHLCNRDEAIMCFLSDSSSPKNRQTVCEAASWAACFKLTRSRHALQSGPGCQTHGFSVWSVRCLQHIKSCEFLRLQKGVENQRESMHHSEETFPGNSHVYTSWQQIVLII